jgi:hypothetical protein
MSIIIISLVVAMVVIKGIINKINQSSAKLAAAYTREIEQMAWARSDAAIAARENQANNDITARQQRADAVRAKAITRALAEQAEVERMARKWESI